MQAFADAWTIVGKCRIILRRNIFLVAMRKRVGIV
jgi:hypothetical protein